MDFMLGFSLGMFLGWLLTMLAIGHVLARQKVEHRCIQPPELPSELETKRLVRPRTMHDR